MCHNIQFNIYQILLQMKKYFNILQLVDTTQSEKRQFKPKIRTRTVPGAVVTSYSGVIPDQFKCQVETHQKFCDRFGYQCYFVEYTSWSYTDIAKHWSKIKAILSVMKSNPKHPWILYLDTDSVVENLPHLLNHSIENFMRNNPNDASTYVYLPDNSNGWSTDIVLIKNNGYGARFMKYFWKLRKVCGDCVGEQCAGQIVLFEALLQEIKFMIENRIVQLPDQVYVQRTFNGSQYVNCCSPRNYCEYPHGKFDTATGESLPRNMESGYYVHGCVINWEGE